MKKAILLDNTFTSKAAALAATGIERANIITKDVLTVFNGESFPASSTSNTHEVPTGRERLMHAIKSGRENYNNTRNGKRIPKKPTKKEMRRALNRLLRTKAA